MASGIFISYRRSDTKSEARSICQRLEKTFGKGKVFIDVDSIRPGEDFQSVLKEDLAKCKVVLVVIGPRWLELLRTVPADGKTIADYVRLEIASALERDLPIVPVLVDGASMPDADDMPDDLKPLAFRQAFFIRHDSFPRDMGGLEQELRRIVSARPIWKVTVFAGLLAISVGIISCSIWWFWTPSAKTYTKFGNFACFAEATYPESWREEASFCASYGCSFGKLSLDACLTMGARRGSKIVIHGNSDTSRADECWLQNSCGDLRSHGEFTMFKM